MNQIDIKNGDWQECRTGELVRFAANENAKVSRRKLFRAAAGGATLVFLVALGLSLQSQPSAEPNYGGIRCSVVREKAKMHLSGKLDATTEAKIVVHLAKCPICAAYMQSMPNEQATANKSAAFSHPSQAKNGRLVSMKNEGLVSSE